MKKYRVRKITKYFINHLYRYIIKFIYIKYKLSTVFRKVYLEKGMFAKLKDLVSCRKDKSGRSSTSGSSVDINENRLDSSQENIRQNIHTRIRTGETRNRKQFL